MVDCRRYISLAAERHYWLAEAAFDAFALSFFIDFMLPHYSFARQLRCYADVFHLLLIFFDYWDDYFHYYSLATDKCYAHYFRRHIDFAWFRRHYYLPPPLFSPPLITLLSLIFHFARLLFHTLFSAVDASLMPPADIAADIIFFVISRH